MIQITQETINESEVLDQVKSPLAGAVILFVGTTREVTGNKVTTFLSYECYADMAKKELAKLESEARAKWDLCECAIVHRIGDVDVGQSSVVVAVSSPHRDAAFQAGRWLIDTLKESVPIWKKEIWSDGSSEWVHPDAPQQVKSTPPND